MGITWATDLVQSNLTNTHKNTQELSAELEHNLHRCSQQEWGRLVRLGQVSLAIYLNSCILYKHC